MSIGVLKIIELMIVLVLVLGFLWILKDLLNTKKRK